MATWESEEPSVGHQNPSHTAECGVEASSADDDVRTTERPIERSSVPDADADSGSATSAQSDLTRTRTNTIIEESDRSELRRIANALADGRAGGIDEVTGPEDLALQPQSSHFDLSKWLQNFIQDLRGKGTTPIRAGVVYQNLNVSGSTPDLQVQQTVVSFLKAPLRVGEILGFRKKPPHRKILRNFDGILQGGELLVVLGRPGSGCSSLLKTISGELHGLHVDRDSTIHYNGIPQHQMIKEFKGEVIYNQEVRRLRAPKSCFPILSEFRLTSISPS